MKLLNKTAFNELILVQEDTVCFHMIEEVKKNVHKYEDATQVLKNFQENWIKPKGITRLDYTIISLSVKYITQQEIPKNGSPRLNYLEDTYKSWTYKLMTHK